MVVLMVAGVLAAFEGVALAQTTLQGTEQTALQGTIEGTLDANNLDDDASGENGSDLATAAPAGAQLLPRNGKILFSGDNFDPPTLETINPDGSNRSSFTPPIIGRQPEWSPDGTKAAFI